MARLTVPARSWLHRRQLKGSDSRVLGIRAETVGVIEGHVPGLQVPLKHVAPTLEDRQLLFSMITMATCGVREDALGWGHRLAGGRAGRRLLVTVTPIVRLLSDNLVCQ
jgi:hypothetical protein